MKTPRENCMGLYFLIGALVALAALLVLSLPDENPPRKLQSSTPLPAWNPAVANQPL